MAPPPPRPASQYRRRILIVGAVLGLALYVIGAPIFNGRIENDLERRVPTELAEAGFVGVQASFSGQDGTLRCEEPLDDPEDALTAAYDIWGVRAIELDRSCRVNRAPIVATTTTAPASDDGETSALESSGVIDVDAASVGASTTASTLATTTVPAADFDTVDEIVTTSPELSLLAVLSAEAAFVDVLSARDDDGITLFAPTDSAFDALSADAIALLRADPALLRRVLEHHAVPGSISSASFVAGELTSLDGGTLMVTVDGTTISVSGATVTGPDIVATNGTVHVIDRVLVPDDVDLSPPQPRAAVAATYADGAVTLDGAVASEVERAALVAAAASGVGAEAVVDQLTVDPDIGLDADTTASLGQLVAFMPVHLAGGVSGFDGDMLYVQGTYLTDGDREAMVAVADGVGATSDLAARPDATDDDAAALEAALNEFVADNPILFQPTSATLSASAGAVLDGIVERVRPLGGLSITIEGHTDSDGNPAANLALSQRRADAVRDALIARGIDGAILTAEGFGSERPVLVDGVEDKAASRRVEFRVIPSA